MFTPETIRHLEGATAATIVTINGRTYAARGGRDVDITDLADVPPAEAVADLLNRLSASDEEAEARRQHIAHMLCLLPNWQRQHIRALAGDDIDRARQMIDEYNAKPQEI